MGLGYAGCVGLGLGLGVGHLRSYGTPHHRTRATCCPGLIPPGLVRWPHPQYSAVGHGSPCPYLPCRYGGAVRVRARCRVRVRVRARARVKVRVRVRARVRVRHNEIDNPMCAQPPDPNPNL